LLHEKDATGPYHANELDGHNGSEMGGGAAYRDHKTGGQIAELPARDYGNESNMKWRNGAPTVEAPVDGR
jgi:hypothetical protein